MPEIPRYVIDNSVVTKWHLKDEESVPVALQVLDDFRQGRIRLLAPELLRHEVASALLRATRPSAGRARIDVTKAQYSLDQFLRLGIELLHHEALTPAAFRLAQLHGSSYYDAVYLATAEMTNTPLLYADDKLRRALGDRFPLALWVEDYQPAR